MQSFFESSVTHALLFGLLFDAIVKVTLLMAFAGLCALALGRASAAARHFVWRMAFTGVVVMLLGTLLLPLLSANSARIVTPLASVPVWRTSDAMLRMTSQQAAVRTYNAALPMMGHHHVGATIIENAPTPALSPATPGESQLLAGAGLLWLCGTLLVLVRAGLRLRAVRVLERHGHAISDERLRAIARHAAAQTGLPALPRLLMQNEQSGLFSPLTWGGWRACVLLPFDALTWPDARLDAVLRHELAHVRRNDWIAQRGAEAVCALVWFHPLVWLAARHLRTSAEQACDDMALTSGVRPALYAQHLLDIANLLRRAPALPPAVLPFLSRLPLESRLRAVLDPRIHRKQLPPRLSRFLFLLTALCLLPTALIVPTVSRTLAQEISVPIRALNNIATLPGGITVEIIGVTNLPPSGRLKPSNLWWRMDGTPLPAPPYQSNNMIHLNDTRLSSRSIGVRISGLTDKSWLPQERSHVMLIRNNHPPQGLCDDLEYALTTQEHALYTEIHTIDVDVPVGATRGTIRYGVAQGAWTDTASDTMQTGSECEIKRSYTKKSLWVWIPSTKKPKGILQVPLIKTTDKLGFAARRVIAYTRKGKATVCSGFWAASDDGKIVYRAFLPRRTTWKDYTRFQLQTRPYQWVDFPNISFAPRQSR